MSNIVNLLSRLKVPSSSTIIWENRDTFPSSPSEGTTVFKEHILYIYATLNGLTTWYPLTNIRDSYVHVQGSPALTWTITHNLNSDDFIYLVYDNTGEIVQLVSPTNISVSSFDLEFTEATSGKCIVFVSSESQVQVVMSDIFEKTGNDITIKGHLIPSEDSVFNLGSATNKWKDAYFSANTIYVGDNLTLTGTGITVTPPVNASSPADQPNIISSKISLTSFTYNPGSGDILIKPSIIADDTLTIGNGSHDVIINAGLEKVVINSENFTIDANGNINIEGTLDGATVDGGTW